MRLAGVGVVIGGWLVAMSGLFLFNSNAGRALLAVVGIAVSLFGSLGMINRYYLDRAIWKK